MANLNPYLNFRGQARDAIEFYHSVFGGDLTVSSFADFGMEVEENEKNQVMHSQLLAPGGMVLMAADVPAHMEYPPMAGFSVSLSGSDEEDGERLRALWAGLSEGGTVVEPLATAPWGDSFGMLADKFGVNWMVNISGAKSA